MKNTICPNCQETGSSVTAHKFIRPGHRELAVRGSVLAQLPRTAMGIIERRHRCNACQSEYVTYEIHAGELVSMLDQGWVDGPASGVPALSDIKAAHELIGEIIANLEAA
jgi:hypothetical protein